MQTYKDLTVWQRSLELVAGVYRMTQTFPGEEKFGLISQMRRSAVSISSNIAEGYGRQGKKENAQFINISLGSAMELETQVIVSKNLGFISEMDCKEVDGLLQEVLKMLYSYRRYLRT